MAMPARYRFRHRFLPDIKPVSRQQAINLKRSWQQGVKVGIGTDVCAGTTFNMLQTLGDDHIGNFMVGKEADFVVIDPVVSPLQQRRLGNSKYIWEQLFMLMTLGDDRNIAQTWVNGRAVWLRDTARAQS